MRRLNFVVLGAGLILAACSFSTGPTSGEVIVPSVATPADAVPAPGLEGQPLELTIEQIQNISKATVQVVAAQTDLQQIRSGSGALISADGQILTTCRIACGAPVLLILATTNADQPPQALYRAEVIEFDEAIDLAKLQINQDVNGNAIDPATLNLPFLPRGDSNATNIGDQVRIFGYSGIAGTSITFSSGTITGIEDSTVVGLQERGLFKTDADIASGFSGGAGVDLFGRLVAIPTTVNPSVQEGVTLGASSVGLLLPINLVGQLNTGAPPDLSGSQLPPAAELDVNEPNNSFEAATGPLEPGAPVEGYISWEDDQDVFFFETNTTTAVTLSLTGIPAGADYDLYVQSGKEAVAKSENQNNSDENIEFRPDAPGRFFVKVISFEGVNASQPYSLVVTFDSGKSAANSVNLSGIVKDGTTGQPFERGVFGVLNAGITCDDFFGGASLDMSVVINTATTDANGSFTISGIPTGSMYGAFFFFGSDRVCQNSWLDIAEDSSDIDIGTITLSF